MGISVITLTVETILWTLDPSFSGVSVPPLKKELNPQVLFGNQLTMRLDYRFVDQYFEQKAVNWSYIIADHVPNNNTKVFEKKTNSDEESILVTSDCSFWFPCICVTNSSKHEENIIQKFYQNVLLRAWDLTRSGHLIVLKDVCSRHWSYHTYRCGLLKTYPFAKKNKSM